ncbi:PAS domain-containing protein [Xinfangfangia pollutisoli]|uniref:PAS domain-containing protein n=1 Tax=Xinfangfangia pollutisoli TaxID=2865960 RepID=UPI001CD5538D|nr:PAS domain-containing protein [Xinfangfangia pollutisoli]
MSAPSPKPSLHSEGSELIYGFDELIYSRTDPRGVIVSGNDVFERLSGVPWRELIGSPHRVIRHPEMPKGFFHLFWSMLKSGEPAVGYVRNRNVNSGYYWVLAAAIPCEGGYFSVRMRPSTDLFATMRGIYADLVAGERNEGLSPEASSQRLLDRLAQLGHADYHAFAAHALALEIRARDRALRRPPDAQTEALDSLLALLHEALAEQSRLVAQFGDLVLLPVNMRLVAARLEPQGGPISQISVNYKLASEEIARRLSGIVSGKGNICGRMAVAVRHSLILTACARLQGELAQNSNRTNNGYTGEERRIELQKLTDVMRSSLGRAQAALREAETLAAQLNEASVDLRRMILGLDTIRILARVESRKSAESQAALTATIDRIDEVQGSISETLKRLMEQTFAITAGLASLRRGSSAAAAEALAEVDAAEAGSEPQVYAAQ